MNEVNKTLFIPLYGKARVSEQGIILKDPMAQRIWNEQAFPIKGKSKSKWLCYNMAMRARVFDDWTRRMLSENTDATVIHIGCGLDSRCLRVAMPHMKWIDCDFPDVIGVRKNYFSESETYSMKCLDAACESDLLSLPGAHCAVVVLEGLSMYLSKEQLKNMMSILSAKYQRIHILMDVYTEFGAKASKYKNPVNDVGVTRLYGIDDIQQVLCDTRLRFVKEHSFTPQELVNELTGFDNSFFKLMFTGKMYRKIYRLYELAGE